MAILNVARMGPFSVDRLVWEYATAVWERPSRCPTRKRRRRQPRPPACAAVGDPVRRIWQVARSCRQRPVPRHRVIACGASWDRCQPRASFRWRQSSRRCWRVSSTSVAEEICAEVVFRHEAPFDRSSLTRWRQRLGEEQIAALLRERLSVVHRTGAIESKDLERVVVRRKIEGDAVRQDRFGPLLDLALRVRHQEQRQRGPKVYSLHAPRWSASAAARHGRRTSSAARCRLPRQPPRPKADSSCCMPRRCMAIRTTATRSVPSSLISKSSQVVAVRRIHGDNGYRGHNYLDRFRVWISGQVHRVTKVIRREMRRRAAVAAATAIRTFDLGNGVAGAHEQPARGSPLLVAFSLPMDNNKARTCCRPGSAAPAPGRYEG